MEAASDPGLLPVRVGLTLRETEKVLISATLKGTNGNITEAASMLGIDRSTLYEKIKRYGI